MKLRIAHIADSHFDERNRLDDNVGVHAAFLEQCHDADVDLILHAGDFFERRSTPAERNALAAFLCDAPVPVIGCKGNHDVEGDLDIFNRLDGVTIASRPTIPGHAIQVEGPILPVRVLALPWFDKANLVSQLDATEDAASTTERTIRAARGLLTALRLEAERVARTGAVPILVGHVLVAGSETSTGQTLIGTTVELSPGDLTDVGCAYVALGHIHKAQSWGRVAYSGSPQRNNFGESEAKGWNLVTIDTERWREPDGVTVEFRELPARRIQLIEVDWTTHPPASGEYTIDAGALLRFRYRIRPEDLHLVDEAHMASVFRGEGAHSVTIEPVLIHETRVRSEEITSARDTFAKCQAWWNAKGIEVPEANQARIRAKLEEIEARQRGDTEVAA